MAKKETNLTIGISEPQKVEEFIESLNHPLLDLVQYIRTFILEVDKSIGEGIYWICRLNYFSFFISLNRKTTCFLKLKFGSLDKYIF